MSQHGDELEQIADDDVLYFRIVGYAIKEDGSVASGAYKIRKKPNNEISVDLARLTSVADCRLRGGPSFGIGSLLTRLPRSLGFTVRHDPLPDNYAHVLAEGENTKEKCRVLAEGTTLILHPEPKPDPI